MNSYKEDEIGSLLDFEYTEKQHLDNLTTYKQLTRKLGKKVENNINISKYYNNLKTLYLLTEKFLESGIEQIVPTIREVIVQSYSVLLTIRPEDNLSEIINELFDIYDKKNWDYQNSAENQLMWEGAYSFKVTLEHKICRIKSFYDGETFKVSDEKINDTIADLINYCLIYVMWCNKGCLKKRDITIKLGDG